MAMPFDHNAVLEGINRRWAGFEELTRNEHFHVCGEAGSQDGEIHHTLSGEISSRGLRSLFRQVHENCMVCQELHRPPVPSLCACFFHP